MKTKEELYDIKYDIERIGKNQDKIIKCLKILIEYLEDKAIEEEKESFKIIKKCLNY